MGSERVPRVAALPEDDALRGVPPAAPTAGTFSNQVIGGPAALALEAPRRVKGDATSLGILRSWRLEDRHATVTAAGSIAVVGRGTPPTGKG